MEDTLNGKQLGTLYLGNLRDLLIQIHVLLTCVNSSKQNTLVEMNFWSRMLECTMAGCLKLLFSPPFYPIASRVPRLSCDKNYEGEKINTVPPNNLDILRPTKVCPCMNA